MPNVYGTELPHLPTTLLVALATSEFRLWMYGNRTLYGVFRFFHLLGMAGFLGMLMLLEVKRLGFFVGSTLQSARLPIIRLMNIAFIVTLVAGILLFLYDPIGAGLHTMFLPKLLLIVAGLVHASFIERLPSMRRPLPRRAAALVALTVWVLVIGCSTWNAVERPFNPADVHRSDPRQD